jgi:hypothetical protein
MKTSPKWIRISGIFFFSISVLLGTAIFALINWAALEAFFYFGYGPPADKPLTTLKCPPVMTAAETGSVSMFYTNPSDLTALPVVRTDISSFGLIRTERSQPSFGPGETRRLRWELTPGDVVFGHLILVQVNVSAYSDLPSRAGTCGTLFVNLSRLTGVQVLAIALTGWLSSALLGWGLWLAGSRNIRGRVQNASTIMLFLTADILVGMLVGYMGWWGAGLACLVLVVLLSVAVISYYSQAG